MSKRGYHCKDCDWRSDPAHKRPDKQRWDHEDATEKEGLRHRTLIDYSFEDYLKDRAYRERHGEIRS